jgi:lipid-A-disaccharide synthase
VKVFLIAGEPSGDRLGAALMKGLKQLVPGVSFAGVGGPEMAAEGLASLFPMEELSVMGLAEVLPRYFHLRRRIRETAAAVARARPEVLVTIDSPDFCLRVARIVRRSAGRPRLVHYVAPTVWAWRKGRAAKIARVVDQVLALFPFEPPHLEAVGLRCDFVGHPVVAEPQASPAEALAFRSRHGIAPEVPLLLALPGSRMGEVKRLLPVFGAALRTALAGRPSARIVVPTVTGVAATVREAVAGWPGRPLVLDPRGRRVAEAIEEKRAAFAAADAALAASGSVSLELAAAGTPMVIAYDVAWLTRKIVARMLTIDTFTLVNLVSGTRAVPEFIGEDCRPAPIAVALRQVLDKGAPEQLAAMALTMERLGRGQEPPGLRAARAVLDGLAR